MSDVSFVPYDVRFLHASARWLRDAEIKRLTLTPDFTDEDQRKWFERLPTIETYRVWGIECDSLPIGATGLKKIERKNGEAEYWGYIGEKSYWGQGIGGSMIGFALEQARVLELRSLYLHVSCENVRAVALYSKFGFVRESETNGMLFMRRSLA